ncbi:ATP-binding protein [Enterococcus faecalis]|nr:ATP-binding protein [Enterococcus faecalis]
MGIESCGQGIKTKFILFSHLIYKLTPASQNWTLIRTLKMFTNIPLLIIDEIGYPPIDKQ